MVRVIQNKICVYWTEFDVIDTITSVVLDFTKLPMKNGYPVELEFIFGKTIAKTKLFWAYEKQTYNKYKIYSKEEIENMSPLTLSKMEAHLNELESEKGPLVAIYDFIFGEPEKQWKDEDTVQISNNDLEILAKEFDDKIKLE